MAEYPVNLDTWEIRPVADGRKHQLRVPVVTPRANRAFFADQAWCDGRSTYHELAYDVSMEEDGAHFLVSGDQNWDGPVRYPYGQVGDRLWVREALWRSGCLNCGGIHYVADMPGPPSPMYHRVPNAQMPRELSRLTLRVKGVRVERAHDISDQDIDAMNTWAYYTQLVGRAYDRFEDVATRMSKRLCPTARVLMPRGVFAAWWDRRYGRRGLGWDTNPWVWVYDFAVRGRQGA